MITCIFGGSLGHNDIGIINMSGLVDYLMEILDFIDPELGTMPSLFGDSSYKACMVIFSCMKDRYHCSSFLW